MVVSHWPACRTIGSATDARKPAALAATAQRTAISGVDFGITQGSGVELPPRIQRTIVPEGTLARLAEFDSESVGICLPRRQCNACDKLQADRCFRPVIETAN